VIEFDLLLFSRASLVEKLIGMDAEHLVGDAEAEVVDEASFPWPLGDGVGEALWR
jgi:hypothetical protein